MLVEVLLRALARVCSAAAGDPGTRANTPAQAPRTTLATADLKLWQLLGGMKGWAVMQADIHVTDINTFIDIMTDSAAHCIARACALLKLELGQSHPALDRCHFLAFGVHSLPYARAVAVVARGCAA
jgi:hypothetical protein